MTITETNALQEKAENFLGRLVPLCEAGIQSNENAVFSEVSKGFGTKEDESETKDLGNYSLSAKLISAAGETLFVPLEKVVDFFERTD